MVPAFIFFLLLLHQTCSKTKSISLKFIYTIPRYSTQPIYLYAFYTAVIPLAAWIVWKSSPTRAYTTSRENIIIILYLLSLFVCAGVFLDIISFSNFRDYSDEKYHDLQKGGSYFINDNNLPYKVVRPASH